MKKLILIALAIILFSLKPAFNQEVFKLTITQPSPLTYTISGSLEAEEGEIIDLDTLFHVEGDKTYIQEWKFSNGAQQQTINNSIFTLTENGVFYLTIIDENGCSYFDSISLNVVTDIGDIFPDNPLNIQVYPNPNKGTFEILIPDCLPGYSIHVINSIGVQVLNKNLECNNSEYLETIVLPPGVSGLYYLLIKKDKKIIYKQKVIIVN